MSGETSTFEEAMDEVRLWSRFLAGLALAAVVTVTMMLCVPLKEEGAGAGVRKAARQLLWLEEIRRSPDTGEWFGAGYVDTRQSGEQVSVPVVVRLKRGS
ncbi:hypothetical protein [Streptomyces qinglanensis]|uniref:hypothetical protein n=1 Tax=Streptomyces qinglanensis TaxID=943816 RepID=UPI003D728CBD